MAEPSRVPDAHHLSNAAWQNAQNVDTNLHCLVHMGVLTPIFIENTLEDLGNRESESTLIRRLLS